MSRGDYSTELKTARSQRRRLTTMYEKLCVMSGEWEGLASTAGVPLDPLFWCAGAQGSMYPFTGFTSNEFSPLEASLLVSERMAFKLHREGLVMETIGADVAVCYEYPSPIIPKSRWRYQMVNMYPEPNDCHPFGTTTQLWGSVHNSPATKKNFGYLMWRKRNCVYL